MGCSRFRREVSRGANHGEVERNSLLTTRANIGSAMRRSGSSRLDSLTEAETTFLCLRRGVVFIIREEISKVAILAARLGFDWGYERFRARFWQILETVSYYIYEDRSPVVRAARRDQGLRRSGVHLIRLRPADETIPDSTKVQFVVACL
jgi:hypothetical protein